MKHRLPDKYVSMFRKGAFSLLLLVNMGVSNAQQRNEQVSQRFSLQIDDLMDLGFIDEKKSYTNTESNEIKEIFEGKTPEFEFRIRTNEPFRLTIQTMAEDSSGTVDADSLLQITLLSGSKNEDDYKDINGRPTPLLGENEHASGQTFNIRYRAKPGATPPADIKTLSLVFTASYP